MSMNKKTQMNITIDPKLKHTFKLLCHILGVDMSKIVVAHIKQYIENNKDKLENIKID